MRRRDFLTLAGSGFLASAQTVHAQTSRKVARIGVLWHAANAEEEGPYLDAVQQGFRELGYVEGRTLMLEHRFPNEEPERFRSMAAELAALKPDMIIAAGPSAASAAKGATATIPIVFAVVPDPVGSRLVESLARPGANITGLSNYTGQLCAKRLEYLKAAIPSLSRVAFLVNPNAPISRSYIEEGEIAAAQLRLTLQLVEVRSRDDLERAFDSMVRTKQQAVAVNPDGLFFQNRALVARLALARSLPSSVYSRETLEVGAFMSYGPDHRAIFRRAALYADRILKGARPADLPVEQPTRFEFLINQKTAKALGVIVPAALMLQADQVIDQ